MLPSVSQITGRIQATVFTVSSQVIWPHPLNQGDLSSSKPWWSEFRARLSDFLNPAYSFLRFIHIIAIAHSSLLLNSIFPEWIYYIWFICSSVDVYLDDLIFTLGILWILLLWTLVYNFSCGYICFGYFLFLTIYLFLAALGLCCCTWAFSSCGEQDLLSSCRAWASHCSGFSCSRARALGHTGFSSCGLWA